MQQSRLERLREHRARDRRMAARASIVAGALAVVSVASALASVGSQERGPSPDAAAQRLLQRLEAQAAIAAPASPGEDVPPEVAAAQPLPVAGPDVVPISGADGLFVPIGQLSIGRIGLVTPVFNGVHDAVLEQGVGHWPGTEGDIVLSGHRTTFLKPFHDLDLLQPGDVAILSTTNLSDPKTYEVVETLIVPEADYVDAVLAGLDDADAETLTMYACHPKGQRTHRIVVRARVSGSPVPPEAAR